MNKIRLLSFQGGGVKGVVALTILDRLYKKGLIKYDDIHSFSGASTGSLIAALCAIGYKPDQSLELYENLAPKIFKRRWVAPKFLDVVIWAAPYDINRLYSEIKNIVGNIKIGDLKIPIVIPVFDVDGQFNGQRSYSTRLIHNHALAREENIFLDWPLADVLAGACCAPTYFNRLKSSQIARGFRDSGLTDNLGALSNYAVCRDEDTYKVKRKQTVLLNLGNGDRYPFGDKNKNSFWKLPDTLSSVKNAIVMGNESLTDQVLSAILDDKYLYYNKPYKDFGLDEYKKIPELIEWAKKLDISELENWMIKNWKKTNGRFS